MASGSFGLTRTGSTSSYVSFTAYWSSTTNVATNQSTVTVTIKASKSSASTSKTYGTYNTRTTVEGTNKDKGNTSFTLNPNSTITLSTQSFTVNHNDNGTKSTTISCSVGGDVMWGNGSKTVTLDTIPRASTITCTSANIGETAQITVTKKYSGFTHVIAYDINGSGGRETGYILADGSTTQNRTQISTTSIGFPIPTRWYSLIPNDSSVTVYLGVDTYSGNTQIGSTQTTTFIARVNPETNRPTLTASVVDTNEPYIALTGDNKRLVKGYSYVKLDYSATPKNYATIKSINVNGTNVSASPYYFTLNQNSISVTATDSRGLAITTNPSFTLVDYFQPSFTLRAVRVEPTSSYFKILFEGSFFNDTFGKVMNTINIRWRYKETSSSDWVIGGMLTSGADYKIIGNRVISGTEDVANEITIGGNFTYDKAWDIKLEVWDMVKTVEVIANVTKGIPTFWWDEHNVYIPDGDLYMHGNNIKRYNEWAYLKLSSRITLEQPSLWSVPTIPFDYFKTSNSADFLTDANSIICNFDGMVRVSAFLSCNYQNEADLVLRTYYQGVMNNPMTMLNVKGTNSTLEFFLEVKKGTRIVIGLNFATNSILIYESTLFNVMRMLG